MDFIDKNIDIFKKIDYEKDNNFYYVFIIN